MYTTNNPTGGAASWTRQRVDDVTNEPNAIACPTSRLCVVTDLLGNVVVGTA